MTNRIQKTIISEFLTLVDKDFITETEVLELISTVDSLYKKRHLTDSDFYRQKIELIIRYLTSAAKSVKNNRTNKNVKLTLHSDLRKIFDSDLGGIDYSRTSLSDLDKLDNDKVIPISLQTVQIVLENLIIPKRRLTSETDFEKLVTGQLADIFGKEHVHRQYSVGGFLALKTDIDVGNGQVGIELKIADNLSATDMQRIIGQVVYYKRRFYNNNLLLFIVSKSTINPKIKELKDFLEELGTVVVFTTAINV
ncbi:MAG: hypothetical protein IPL35_15480 [Sphingobacteriales bacterium]|nr:hypothetical protein [Sphingobacteriales bacterium]